VRASLPDSTKAVSEAIYMSDHGSSPLEPVEITESDGQTDRMAEIEQNAWSLKRLKR